MSEQRAATHWELVDENLVAEYSGGEVVGLLIYGTIDYARLNAIPLRRIASNPTRERWTGAAPTREQIETAGKRKPKVVILGVEDLPGVLKRVPGEDPGEFYERVAHAYYLLANTTGTPTTTIAQTAGVPKTTAAAWVREARKRGFLAAPTKGKVT